MNSINTNEYANILNANITKSSNSLSEILERMSSGFRINSAKDDASGMKISAKMDVSLSGQKVAQSNLQSGVSLLNVAQGALDNASDILNRLRSLNLKAMNGTYSTSEKEAISQEADELNQELERIQKNTKYNQINLFSNYKKEATSTPTQNTSTSTKVLKQQNLIEKSNEENISLTSLDEEISTTELISGAFELEKGQEQEIEIDGVKYTITNQNTTKSSLTYSKDSSTGEILFTCNNFKIVGQNDVAHKFVINGRSNSVYGGNLDDIFNIFDKNASSNTFYGLGGNDTFNTKDVYQSALYGGDGDDIFNIGSGCYSVYGGDGDDIFNVNNFYGTIYGENGDDTFNLIGTTVNSPLFSGGDGEDTFIISSKVNNCTIDGGNGVNKVIDNGGKNVAKINVPDANSFTIDFTKYETKEITINGLNYTVQNLQNDTKQFIYSIDKDTEQITFSSSSFKIIADKNQKHNVVLSGQNSNFYGGNLGDEILSQGTNNKIYTGDGDNHVTFKSRGSLAGGNGNDTIELYSTTLMQIFAGGGNNKIYLYSNLARSYIDTGTGNSILEARYTNNSYNKNLSVNTSVITGNGNSTLNIGDNIADSIITGFNQGTGADKSDNSYTKINISNLETKTITVNKKNYTINNTLTQGGYSNSFIYKYDSIEDKVIFGVGGHRITAQSDTSHNMEIYGTSSEIHGGDLDDIITIKAGDSIQAYGGKGNDTLTTEQAANYCYLYGEAGDDTIYGYGTSGAYYGGIYRPNANEDDGDDTFYIQGANTRELNGGVGNDTYYINNSVSSRDDFGNNIYYITNNNTNLSAGSGNDTFYVSGDNNTVAGGGGDDYFIVTGKNNRIDGGVGTNYIVDKTGQNTTTNTIVDPNSGALMFSHLDEVLSFEIDGKTYTVTNNNIDGNGVNQNSISYTYNKNTGEIILTGSDLTIDCSDGVNHNIRLKGSNNILNGGNKKDTIIVEDGENNLINGNDGDDDITLNSSNNSVDGGRGNDKITINASSNKEITGGAGNDIIQINCDNNTNIKTGTGNDTIRGTGNNNNVNLDYGSNDILLKGVLNNIQAGNGNNRISVVGDENAIATGVGTNTIGVNGKSNIIANGGSGTNTVIGNDNFVYGSSGDYNVQGENNIIDVDGGKIKVRGDNNNIQTSNDTEYDFEGDLNTLITLGGYQNLTLKGNNNNLSFDKSKTNLKLNGNNNQINSNNSTDKIDIKGNFNSINSGDKDDNINIQGNSNILTATGGNNEISARGDENSLTGGSGKDSFTIRGGLKNYVDGGSLLRNTLCDYGKETTSKNVIDITPIPFEADLQIGDKAEDYIHLSLEFNIGDFYLDFSSDEAIRENLDRIDEMIDRVNKQILSIGSTLNRLDSIYESQTTTIQNLTAAKGLITDADIAEESVKFNQKNIMQQISTSLFAQTNQLKSSNLLGLINGIRA